MKEATGEASMTGITIAIIAVIAAIAIPIVSNLLKGLETSSCCQANGGVWQSGQCYDSKDCAEGTNGKLVCSGTAFTPVCE